MTIVRNARNFAATTALIFRDPSNHGRRWQYYLRYIHHQANTRVLARPTLTTFADFGLVLAYPHSGGGASRIVYTRVPDFTEISVWLARLSSGDLFVDVGANIGMYSLMAASLGADVIALEPDPSTARKLRQNAHLNAFNIECVQAAAAATEGEIRMTGGPSAVNHKLTTAESPSGAFSARAVRLDRLLCDRGMIAGLKIDVEGFELDVLRGATGLLRTSTIRLIQLEWNQLSRKHAGHPRYVIAEFLSDYDYRIFRPSGAGTLVPADVNDETTDVFAIPANSPSSGDG